MPVKHVPYTDIDAYLAKAEAEGHTVTSVHDNGGGLWIATSAEKKRAKPGEKETR